MPTGDKPNIVVVVMDCVRAQNLPVYGYPKPTAPRISELAGDAIRYDNAISVAEQTLSATSALFTGTYPSTHGLFVTGDTLNADLSTLAGALTAGGYDTHCINCNNPYVSDFTDLMRGFEHSFDAFPLLRQWLVKLRWGRKPVRGDDDTPESTVASRNDDAKPSNSTNRQKLVKRMRWLMTRAIDGGAGVALDRARRVLTAGGTKPKFVYVHLMETHMYYHPPAGHTRLFLPDTKGRKLWRVNQNPLHFISGDAPMDQLDFEIVEGLYNGALHYTDKLFGRFYDRLRSDGLLDQTILVLLADHGESFGEHGYLGHGQCVYDTVVRVPLLIWGPVVESAHRGSAVGRVVQNIDLTASLLEWSGCKDHPMHHQMEGMPLPLSPGAARTREVAISQSVRVFDTKYVAVQKELNLFDKASVAARTEKHKLIWNATEPAELYDLAADPDETIDIIDKDPETAGRLQKEIDAVLPQFEEVRHAALQRFRDRSAGEVDSVVEDRLRELGYIE